MRVAATVDPPFRTLYPKACVLRSEVSSWQLEVNRGGLSLAGYRRGYSLRPLDDHSAARGRRRFALTVGPRAERPPQVTETVPACKSKNP